MRTIYDMMADSLAYVGEIGDRHILYRGKELLCTVLLGNTNTKLEAGGLQTVAVVHVKILRKLVPIGADGEPHTMEPVSFPAKPEHGLVPREFIIDEVIPEEYAYNFTLVDPTK
jgi:hypothetical protein